MSNQQQSEHIRRKPSGLSQKSLGNFRGVYESSLSTAGTHQSQRKHEGDIKDDSKNISTQLQNNSKVYVSQRPEISHHIHHQQNIGGRSGHGQYIVNNEEDDFERDEQSQYDIDGNGIKIISNDQQIPQRVNIKKRQDQFESVKQKQPDVMMESPLKQSEINKHQQDIDQEGLNTGTPKLAKYSQSETIELKRKKTLTQGEGNDQEAIQLNIHKNENIVRLSLPQQMPVASLGMSSGPPPRAASGSKSRTNYTAKIKEEEMREKEREMELQYQIEQKRQEEELIEHEKQYYKLADYFVTIGIDDYHLDDEIYRKEEKKNVQRKDQKEQQEEKEQQSETITNNQNDSSMKFSNMDSFQNTEKQTGVQNLVDPSQIDLSFMDDDSDFNRVVSQLELFVIQDKQMFSKNYKQADGSYLNVKHPRDIDLPNEKWIDLRGDEYIYLKIQYDDIKNVKRPISDINFYKISKMKQSNKMQIPIKESIEPLPLKVFGDIEADKKYKKTRTKLVGKNGKHMDSYNFYGDYDLTSFFEDQNQTGEEESKSANKNLCLCISFKKQPPIQEIILIIGQRIDSITGQVYSGDQHELQLPNVTTNWDVPEGYRKLAYSLGMPDKIKDRLFCLKTRDLMKRKLRAKVIDRYPPEGKDRHYYPFPQPISDFVFPSGLVLKTQEDSPEFFNFSLTHEDGVKIFGTCLIFDEEPSLAFKNKLKSLYVKNINQIRTLKALCILSHYSFNRSFKEILMQIYRMQISQTRMDLPIERYITNIIDEIPLPDEGRLLVQHEVVGKVVSFYRPIDQHSPYVESDEIENVFKCLDVDNIIEVFQSLLLERKVLIVSQHKALLTQCVNFFVSILFPFQWQHTLIPILPITMLDILDAPFPYLIGVEPNARLEDLDIENDVIRVDLDYGSVTAPTDMMLSSQIPTLPFKEHKVLKQRLLKATEHIEQIPDQMMLAQIDKAFNQRFMDPDEEFLFDHLEIRDSFIEFMSSIMSGYTRYIKDPSDQPEQITCSKDCFDIDKFRLFKDAKKNYMFIYKLTETNHFSYYIECRCFGKCDIDNQIMYFDKLINQKRTRMQPRLIFPFHEEKTIKSMPPNEQGLREGESWSYKVFPKFQEEYLIKPRKLHNYNSVSLQLQIIGNLISNEKIVKMHDNEWARYMAEVLILLWYQIFCSTLPIYSAHSPQMIDFARRLLNFQRNRLKPMRDIEFIYRRLFESCGTCKQITDLRQIYKEMVQNKIEPDKVTSCTYYQALLQCKRRGGVMEGQGDIRKSYFHHRMEDYQDKLSQNNDNGDDRRSQNRKSNLSIGQKLESSNTDMSNNKQRQNMYYEDENIVSVDFEDILDRREATQRTAMETQANNRISNPIKLSQILEGQIYFEIIKQCPNCKEPLREEEVLTGFQKNINNHKVNCPICKLAFVPKFTIYSENESIYLKGRKGLQIDLLPPVTLYREFINIISKNDDQLLMSENFILDHQSIFWNIILYFKIVRLPIFMLDLDYSPFHQKAHCSTIKKFLPVEKSKTLFGSQSRRNSASKQKPPILDSNALKRFNEQQSPGRYGGVGNNMGSGTFNMSSLRGSDKAANEDGNNSRSSQMGHSGRPSSIKRVANSVINMFNNSNTKKNSFLGSDKISQGIQDNQMGSETQLDNSYSMKMPGKQQTPQLNKQNLPPRTSSKQAGGIMGIHFNEQNMNKLYAQNQSNQNQHLGGTFSQAVENDKKGFPGMVEAGFQMITNLKKPSSQKSGGKGGSQRSGGAGSVITSLSDLEKVEKIMNEAQHADKNIVKYFGKNFEEFRREMHYQREIIFSDMLTQYGAGLGGDENKDEQIIQM